MKEEFEEILKEFGFTFDGFMYWMLDRYTVFIFDDGKSCDFLFRMTPMLRGRIKSPDKLKALLDILMETA